MHNGNSYLAIIPARGGSKRLPGKNLRKLNGKPLIAWSIEAGLNSKYIDEVLVTSDDDEILTIAEKYGSKVLKRPEHLATDTAKTFDAIEHAINTASKYDYIVLLQPTSPLRTSENIDEAIERIKAKDADAIISVNQTEHSPLWCNTLPDDGDMSGFIKDDIKSVRSQDLPLFYRLNGAIYIAKTNRLLTEKTFFIKDKVFSYVMDVNFSIDIDNEIDFKFAQMIMAEEYQKIKDNI